MADEIDPCAVAHGTAPAAAFSPGSAERTLVAVFASPVSGFLLRYAADAGFRGLIVEPDAGRASGAAMAGFTVQGGMPEDLEGADVVVTDHHRDELGAVLRDALATKARWVGVLGNPRHPAPHIPALEALGVTPGDIARVHRPIGLNIGSRTPPEIAIATLAGLIADRNSRPGGFFSSLSRTHAADSMTGTEHGVRLRTAKAADYGRIIAVVDDWWGRPVRHALPRLFLDHFHATSFVAERDGDLAGFLIGFLSPSLRDVAYIQFVGINPRSRGNGLARQLYESFFALAVADGRRLVRAVTAPQNSVSIAFHTAMGFTVTEPIPGYDGPSSAKVVFERRLP